MLSAFKTALFCTLIQVGVLVALAPPSDGVLARYLRLNNWDSEHYLSIARDGYHVPPQAVGKRGADLLPLLSAADVHENRANVGYFPAYPLLARGCASLLGVSVPLALLIVAQAFAFLFWFYFAFILGRLGVSREVRFFALGSVLIHPAASFLVTGYSESLFLACALGFIYFSRKAGAIGALASALHGFGLSATRVVGVPAALAPWIGEGFGRRNYLRAALLSAVSLSGALLFFLWCHQEFGVWNLYIKLQELGWGNHPNYFAILDPRSYIPHFFFEHTVDSVSRVSIPFTLGIFIWAWVEERRGMARVEGVYGWKSRLNAYFVAFVLFYIALSGKANAKMDSMVRYTFPSFVILILMITENLTQQGRSEELGWRNFFLRKKPAIRILFIFGFALALATQLWLIYRFLRGAWTA